NAPAGVDPNAYGLNVTATGGGNTFVGGLFGTFTAEGGGGNTFVVQDPSLLGASDVALETLVAQLPAAFSSIGGTFNGGGDRDTFAFVGGAAGPFASVTLNEPAGAMN